MSWDAILYDTDEHMFGQWNYTHNTNGMIDCFIQESADLDKMIERSADWWERRDRFDRAEEYRKKRHVSWWMALDRMTGPEGRDFLDRCIKVLEADPERFRAMNPENGWGNYEGLLDVLRQMRNAVPTYDTPTKWVVHG